MFRPSVVLMLEWTTGLDYYTVDSLESGNSLGTSQSVLIKGWPHFRGYFYWIYIIKPILGDFWSGLNTGWPHFRVGSPLYWNDHKNHFLLDSELPLIWTLKCGHPCIQATSKSLCSLNPISMQVPPEMRPPLLWLVPKVVGYKEVHCIY